MELCDVEAIFNSRKLFLRAVNLEFNNGSTDPKKFIHAFTTGGITTLESVQFLMRLPLSNTFDNLVKMNKSLHKAGIILRAAKNEEVSTVIGRVIETSECFLQSPVMKCLDVVVWCKWFGKVPEVEEILYAKYRHLRVQASIFASEFPQRA